MHTHQVNYEKVIVEGPMKGRRYHAYERFTRYQDAHLFAGQDGLVITPFDGNYPYRQEASVITNLSEFESRGKKGVKCK